MISVRSPALHCCLLLILTVCFGCRVVPERGCVEGSKLLRAFVSDRKAAGTFLAEYPGFTRRLRAALAKSTEGYQLAWSNAEPQSGAPAEHRAKRDLAVIEIRVSSCLHPADQIVGLFYEAVNAERFPEFARIAADARKGLLWREGFIDAIVRVEHNAIVELKEACRLDFVLPAEVAKDTTLYQLLSQAPTEAGAFMIWHRSREESSRTTAHYGQFFDDIESDRKEETKSKLIPDVAGRPRPTNHLQPLRSETK